MEAGRFFPRVGEGRPAFAIPAFAVPVDEGGNRLYLRRRPPTLHQVACALVFLKFNRREEPTLASTTHGGGFARAAETEPGYKRSEVDRLFTRLAEDYEKLSGAAELPEDLYTSRRIRQVVFREEPGGYQLDVVDRALEKIEERFAKLERSRYIEAYGLDNWERSLVETGELLAGRLERPAGERFRRPSKRRHMGYFVGDVDAICDRVYAQLNSEEPLDPSVVRHAKFRPASGTVSYEESQVDAFLDRCIELLQDLL